ncbi:hypothetical protein CO180_00475 [candidate division WWE3 bacterium CG_4_9_14_3_um_filter_41_6]|uniref:Uncharacterized protein n=1 Tax=candidate division WWE3 bacterium CG_4_10_14_0_2_um_filter_41_14 TaxID=1975072 RepID=A0A2M7TJ98_UNCKA|nr:MAG: hypothetical protein COY32_03080 [candidate division WWE3 bacterium CG_4_10_14_0_2_um_filter_41_14]PJA39547.1 MAG: hypothetical protein CO180_00475 [candidate division WWE3 bacterium CG_4_9_14_3_um_filter_41_6]
MLDIRINPHFQDLTMLWIQNLEYFIVSIILFYSYLKNKNNVALFFGAAALVSTVGYAIAGISYQYFPDNFIVQAFASNIIANILFYAGFVFLLLGLLIIRLPQISLYIGIPVFLYGILAITPYVVNFVPFTVMENGVIDFHHTFIDDFSQFMFGVILVFGFSGVFFKTYTSLSDKLPAIFFGLGFVSVIFLPAITASTSGVIAYYLHYGVIFGGFCHIVGLLLSAAHKPRVLSEQKAL